MAEAFAPGGSYIQTASGLYVQPLDLDPKNVRIEDIAHHLSRQARYSGATRGRWGYSVAQHCCVVSDHCEVYSYEGLMHDCAEYVLQDLVRPLKQDPRFGQTYRGAEKRVERVIAPVFGLVYPWPEEVKLHDNRALATERRDLMPATGRWKILDGVEPYPETIVPWTPERSRKEFLKRFHKLSKGRV